MFWFKKKLLKIKILFEEEEKTYNIPKYGINKLIVMVGAVAGRAFGLPWGC